METPLISIIVPCYNVERYIDKSLESILNQSYPNWECIAINDGSKDNTEIKIKEWTERDQRFKLISQINAGPSAARNAGLKNALGDCIFFYDSDDLLDVDCLKSLLKLYNPSIDIVIGKSAEVLNQTTEIIKYLDHFPITEEILSNKNFVELALKSPFSVVPWNKLFNTKFIKENNLTFLNGVNHEDEVWFFETIHLAKKIIFNSKVTYYYNVGNQDSVMKNYGLDKLKSYLKLIENIFNKYYSTEKEAQTKKIVGTYVLNFQIEVISGFFRFLKKNDVPFRNEGISLIKEHIENYPINDFSIISDKKSIQYELFIKYAKVNPETAFKLIRNTNKKNILKSLENMYLIYNSRKALK